MLAVNSVLLLGSSKDLSKWTVAYPGRWHSKRPADTIPECEELAIVVVVEEMVVGVVGGAIDVRLDGVGYAIVAVMDRHSPQVHKDEQEQVRVLVEWKYKRVQVVRAAL